MRPSEPGSSDPVAHMPRDTPAQTQKPDDYKRLERTGWHGAKICLYNKEPRVGVGFWGTLLTPRGFKGILRY